MLMKCLGNRGWGVTKALSVNSLWPSDAIWHQGSGSTLAHVMASCRMAPSHYLNQCWLIIIKVQWHSSEGSLTKDASAISLKNDWWKIPFQSPRGQWVNSLAFGRFINNFKSMIFKFILQKSSLGALCEIVLRWMPQNHSNEISRLVQVMSWCQHTPSHYLIQCWPRSMLPYSITRTQWINFFINVYSEVTEVSVRYFEFHSFIRQPVFWWIKYSFDNFLVVCLKKLFWKIGPVTMEREYPNSHVISSL